MPLRIAFGHKARSGKDTACEYLLKKIPNSELIRFSDPLYQILYYSQNVIGIHNEKDSKFLQDIGSWGRSKDEDIWAKIATNNLKDNKNYFCADLRYENEARILKEKGFILVKVNRLDRPIDRDPNHPSEIGLDNFNGWDFVIENNGTIEDLHKKIDEIIKAIRLPDKDISQFIESNSGLLEDLME